MGFYNDMHMQMSVKGFIGHQAAGLALGGAAFMGMHHHVKKENNGQGGKHPLLKSAGAFGVPDMGLLGAAAYGYKKRDSALGRLFYHGETIGDWVAKHGEVL